MKPKPKPEHSRAGKRAPGQTATTISMSEETLAKVRYLAADLTQTAPPAEIHRLNEPPTAYQATRRSK